MNEREIEGYNVRVLPKTDPKIISLIWRDHAETAAAEERGESHLMGLYDIDVPISVLLAAAEMLK